MSTITHQKINIDDYFCKSRLRIDTWNRLKESISQLNNQKEEIDSTDLQEKIRADFCALEAIQSYWAFPGDDVFRGLLDLFVVRKWELLENIITVVARLISTDHYRIYDWESAMRDLSISAEEERSGSSARPKNLERINRPYFETLVIDSLAVSSKQQIRDRFLKLRNHDDAFIYDVVIVSSFEDAIIATLLNYNIQAVIVSYSFPYDSSNKLSLLNQYIELSGIDVDSARKCSPVELSGVLARVLQAIRPELDLYLLSETSVEEVSEHLHRYFRRCFFGSEEYLEMHLTILKGIQQRYETPFFTGLQRYALQPTGVFHALPISRGKSISKSHWIQDYGEFYGERLFLSETSTTSGGLDSLLNPSGSIKKSKELASVTFGSNETLYVTNGTSTASKIVLQAITQPGDIVIFARDCHQSHHFGSMLSGIHSVIVDGYSLHKYGIFGGVSSKEIKRCLLELKRNGLLKKVRCIVMTNLTFDGIAYHPEKFMTECLAIKPDLIFVWDEAWFAYGYFTPVTRRRSAMHAATKLKQRFSSSEYRIDYKQWKESLAINNDDELVETALLPDPSKVRVRVYSIQSTHKTLTALRQASMIHIRDEDFDRKVATSMNVAFLTHTSTSPNYQILASLDIARRQMNFEGYELVQKAFELSIILREQLAHKTPTNKYFRVLDAVDMTSEGMLSLSQNISLWKDFESAWINDELSLEPTRVTIDVSRTGMDGEAIRHLLHDEYDIQVNKTTRNTVLFIIHIGSTRGMITYLIESLTRIAENIEKNVYLPMSLDANGAKKASREQQMESLGLPRMTGFHEKFALNKVGDFSVGDIRQAYYEGQQPNATKLLPISDETVKCLEGGGVFVSAAFVIPYPPGYPIVVPGQLISPDMIRYLLSLKKERVHGIRLEAGLPVFSTNKLIAH